MGGSTVEIGISVVPEAAGAERAIALALEADRAGLDLVGIQDHPYQRRFLDTWTLLSALAPQTRRVRLFPDVANLPLRPPAMLAKAAASLDLLSGGRVELGLGAGAFWDGVAAMGGPRRSPGEAVEALEEAIRVIRLVWSGEEGAVTFPGRHYRLEGLRPGPAPAHPIGIWLGAYRPRMLGLTGRLADGWVPSQGYLTPERFRAAADLIDRAAEGAGRDPREVRRIYNVSGRITDGAVGEGPLDGPPGRWVETLAGWRLDLGIDAFVVWPAEPAPEQVARLGEEVAPALRGA